jgi:type IV secretory pathway VirB10-like protein
MRWYDNNNGTVDGTVVMSERPQQQWSGIPNVSRTASENGHIYIRIWDYKRVNVIINKQTSKQAKKKMAAAAALAIVHGGDSEPPLPPKKEREEEEEEEEEEESTEEEEGKDGVDEDETGTEKEYDGPAEYKKTKEALKKKKKKTATVRERAWRKLAKTMAERTDKLRWKLKNKLLDEEYKKQRKKLHRLNKKVGNVDKSIRETEKLLFQMRKRRFPLPIPPPPPKKD